MKVLLDTNVFISAALNPNGIPAQAIYKANDGENEGYISQYSIDELNNKIRVKFSSKVVA